MTQSWNDEERRHPKDALSRGRLQKNSTGLRFELGPPLICWQRLNSSDRCVGVKLEQRDQRAIWVQASFFTDWDRCGPVACISPTKRLKDCGIMDADAEWLCQQKAWEDFE